MSGPLNARVISARSVTVVMVALLGLSGCGRIDKSQWRPLPSLSTRDTTVTSTARTADSWRANSRSTRSTATVTTTVTGGGNGGNGGGSQLSDSALGVTAGATGGARRRDSAAVQISTPLGTCWLLIVDGNSHRACGNAVINDVRGARAGRVFKASGPDTVLINLLVNGRAINSGQVRAIDHYTTVQG